ncbi:MAG: hypothetical protein GWM98_12165 [Nitrospinaceae bacterium]|nr:hypothetical protein [Nitrospinaceae bacterium]NIR55010.1 hypothetical protein [Nitrospinaceae bacterium]NIS85529.1 hypothetical protein [Nitrospinaceae bacterium]NIT82363.1 hypothetical protein [Nitrospinaceae bacterium]NIU96733.1 hypothetical protein [Nitrospinaceae bacterium]
MIGLTVLTVGAFFVFFLKLFSTFMNFSEKKEWKDQRLEVAEQLRSEGLTEQAIAQYVQYLDQEEVDLKVRARVSQTIGELYAGRENCAEALAWFYQAREAQPAGDVPADLKSAIAACRQKVRRTSEIP